MFKKSNTTRYIAIGIAVGTAIGIATDNLPIWLSLGVAVGAGLSGFSKNEGQD